MLKHKLDFHNFKMKSMESKRTYFDNNLQELDLYFFSNINQMLNTVESKKDL